MLNAEKITSYIDNILYQDSIVAWRRMTQWCIRSRGHARYGRTKYLTVSVMKIYHFGSNWNNVLFLRFWWCTNCTKKLFPNLFLLFVIIGNCFKMLLWWNNTWNHSNVVFFLGTEKTLQKIITAIKLSGTTKLGFSSNHSTQHSGKNCKLRITLKSLFDSVFFSKLP